MNIFIYELKQNKKNMIIWGITYIALISVFMQFLSSFLEQTDSLKAILDNMPAAYMKAMNFDIGIIFSKMGFFSFVYSYVILIGAIQAFHIGCNLMSKEKRLKAAEFLMTKPKTREKIFLMKFLTGIALLIFNFAIVYVTSLIFLDIGNDNSINMKTINLICTSYLLVQIIFYTLAIFIGCAMNKIKSVISVTMGVTLGLFILGMVEKITGSEILRCLVPYSYFEGGYIIENNSYNSTYLYITMVISVVFTIGAYITYKKKDIKI